MWSILIGQKGLCKLKWSNDSEAKILETMSEFNLHCHQNFMFHQQHDHRRPQHRWRGSTTCSYTLHLPFTKVSHHSIAVYPSGADLGVALNYTTARPHHGLSTRIPTFFELANEPFLLSLNICHGFLGLWFR